MIAYIVTPEGTETVPPPPPGNMQTRPLQRLLM